MAERTAGWAGARVRNQLGGVPRRQALASWNQMFDRALIPALQHERRTLEAFDVALWTTLNDTRLLGQIVFEYGSLLNAVSDWAGLRVLDIGTGRSTLPQWMAAQRARVVSFELPSQYEKKFGGWFGRVAATAHHGVEISELQGSMRALPLADNSFDLVTSLSVVEHLDTDLPSRAYVPYEEQRRRLAIVLDEMVRVTKPGGLVYLTSECCDYEAATFDAWRSAYYYIEGPPLSAAWPVGEVPRLFYDYLGARNCPPFGIVAFDPASIAEAR